MKSRLTATSPSASRVAVGLAALALVVLAALPVVVSEAWRDLLMGALSPLCHQLPGRSFAVGGVPFGLCHRCTAILFAMGAVLLAPVSARHLPGAGLVLAIALAPMAVDWAVDAAGVLANTMPSRVATGLWGGAVIGLLIGQAASRDRGLR